MLNNEQILYKKFCLRLHLGLRSFSDCCVSKCVNNDIEFHFVRKLHRVYKIGNNVSVLINRNKREKGLIAFLSILNRKYILFCSKHHLEFGVNKFSPLCFKTIKFTLGANLGNLNYKKLFYT